MEIWGNLSFMKYTGIIFQVEGEKKSQSYFFLMYPQIITYMIDKETCEVSQKSDFQFIRSTWCLQLIYNYMAFQENKNEPYEFL